MTPDEWAELDRLQRGNAEARAAWADGESDLDTLLDRYIDAERALIRAMLRHTRELIDAARPKCQRCDGNGVVGCGCGGIDCRTCTDCDGTGWAK